MKCAVLLFGLSLIGIASSFPLGAKIFDGQRQARRTIAHGIFDKFVESMEGNYKGEENSAYALAKAADAKKAEAAKKKSEARRNKGWTKLEDVKVRTFAKETYKPPSDEPAAKAEEKKKKGWFGL
mmetsp:Transcript_28265/g.57895  ORF Transcript_28265/g.57895 Transcript_28265/m.57895 type:complete len:125 (-) Transcript_28265:257-631(-)